MIMSPLTYVGMAPELNDQPGYRIGVQAIDGGFPSLNASPVMIIKNVVLIPTGYDPIDPTQLVFTLTETQKLQVGPGDSVVVQYGTGPQFEIWDCGSLLLP